MNWSKWVRQIHRWLSIAFTTGVLAYIVAMRQGEPGAWMGLLAAVPLAMLLFTGLYLFALPYVTRRRGRHAPTGGRHQTI